MSKDYVLAYPGCPSEWQVKPEDHVSVTVYAVFDWWIHEYDEIWAVFFSKDEAIEYAKKKRTEHYDTLNYISGFRAILVRELEMGKEYNQDALDKDAPKIVFEC